MQHACPLPNCQPDPWPVLNDPLEDAPSLIKATAGEDQIKHTHPVFAPLLDLVEVPAVGVGWIVGFFVEPVAHYAARATTCVAVFLFDRLVRAQQDRCRHIEAEAPWRSSY